LTKDKHVLEIKTHSAVRERVRKDEDHKGSVEKIKLSFMSLKRIGV
jgi:hypothetical protein